MGQEAVHAESVQRRSWVIGLCGHTATRCALELVTPLDVALKQPVAGGGVGLFGDGGHPEVLAPEDGLEGDGVAPACG